MSVPLDRLYNFLYDIANRDDLLIYQFFPHGSRKLDHFQSIFDITSKQYSWAKIMTMPCMIMHDQEPLMYHLYTKQDFKEYIKKYYKDCPESLADLVSTMHLRACVERTSNLYDQTLLCHSEQNSQDLELYQQHGFIGVYYWSHALLARDWYRYAESDPKLAINFENITHDFLIYNRAWSGTREYRLSFAEMLANNDLISCCKTSFSPVDGESQYSQHKFVNPNLAIQRDDLHQLYPANTSEAVSSADYANEDYASIAIEVVLETLFDDQRHHLTEKTLRPIACGRPFVLASTAGSLQYLKQYGFETFHGLIDESYDTILDPHERLSAIVQEMIRIRCLDPIEKKLLWTKLYKIAEYNKNLFFSIKWQDQIVREFKDNFDSAIDQMTVLGTWQNKIDQLASWDPEMILWRNNGRDKIPKQQDRDKLACWQREKQMSSSRT